MGIAETFESLGKPLTPINFPDGSRLLVLPFGGRVLGLYAPGSDKSFLWMNPAVAKPKTALAYYSRPDAWPNPGGDRTWLSPELEFFIGDLEHPFDKYRVPPALDPGDWRVTEKDGRLSLGCNVDLPLLRTGKKVRCQINKSYLPAPNPLRNMNLFGGKIQYAGYTQRSTLDAKPLETSCGPVRVGIWNLLQLPTPGEMFISTYYRSTPKCVFGHLGSDCKASARYVRWSMGRRSDDAKISMSAEPLTGRAGYLYASSNSEKWNLVIRNFSVNPSRDYADALWSEPEGPGYVFQACSVNGGAERFSEMEYHAPAILTQAGQNRMTDESEVWAFRGAFEDVALIAKLLLGADVTRANRTAK